KRWRASEKVRCLYALLPSGGRRGGTRDAWDHSSAPVRQGGIGETHRTREIIRRTGIAGCRRRIGSATARSALPSGRALHWRSGVWFGQDLRHRSLVSRSGRIPGGFELFKFRRFPSAPDAASVQRSRWKKPVLPHVERIWSRPAEAIRCAHRKLSAAGWFSDHSRKIAALLWRKRDPLSCSGVCVKRRGVDQALATSASTTC